MARKKHWGRNMQEAQKRRALIRQGQRSAHPSALPVARIELARTWIDRALLDREASLTAKVFPAYGYMSAYERTQLFTQAYEASFREMHAKYFDLYEAERARPINPTFELNSPQEMSGLWACRQQADGIGVPYEFYIRQATEAVIDRWQRKRVPRPNQLWRDSQVGRIIDEWAIHRSVGGHLPRDDWDPRFRADAFRGDAAQLRLLGVLEEWVGSGRDHAAKVMRLANFLRQGWIALDTAVSMFGEALVSNSRQSVSDGIPVAGVRASEFSGYLPSCLGLSAASAECSMCQFKDLCDRVVSVTHKRLVASYGSTEPRKDRERMFARERQRRFRERRREQHWSG